MTGIGKRKKINKRFIVFIVVMLAPALLHLLIFWFGVQIQTLVLVFQDPDTGRFVWFDNFAVVINSLFGNASANAELQVGIRNTFIFFMAHLLLIPMCIFTAYLTRKKMLCHTFVKIMLYLPAAISGIMMATLYQRLMLPNGPVFTLINEWGWWDNSMDFMVEHGVAYIVIFDVWIGLGSNLIIWLGAMSRIPEELLESAQLDGITTMKEFFYIVLPLIWPTFITMVTLQIINIFGSTGSILLFTNGAYNTWTISFWMYYLVMNGTESMFNYSAATGLFFTLLTIPILVAGRKIMAKFGGAVEY